MMPGARRRTVLVTGVGRRRSIGAGLALGLAEDGWDLVLNYWAPYGDRVSYARRVGFQKSAAPVNWDDERGVVGQDDHPCLFAFST